VVELKQKEQEGVDCGHLNWDEEKLLRAEASGLLPQGGNVMRKKKKKKKKVNLPVLRLFLSFPSP
jgi:hypothetical protein